MGKIKPKSRNARYIIIASVFCAVCLLFLTVLIRIQIKGTTLPPRESGYVRTYTVPGVRGEIYDCNGKKLVSNADRYDLVYEYGAMPDTRAEVNRSLLDVMAAIEQTGNGGKLSEDHYILSGTYPNMKFLSSVRDEESDGYYYYKRFLDDKKMSIENTKPRDVADYFVSRYRLYSSLYTEEEITKLIRLYYEMERVGFGNYQSYTIASGINKELITLIEEKNIEGVNFRIMTERVYEYPGIASHILGRTGKITAETVDYYMALGYPLDAIVGTSGCEQAFEEYLRSSSGVMCIKYDDDGNMIEKYYEVEPTSGSDVYLTIDIELQIAAEEALAENVEMIESSDAGAVTVIDPNSGRTLAVASNPTYDLSLFTSRAYYNSLVNNKSLPLYNRALSGVYAPGSTYKLGVAIAALESGTIDGDDTFYCDHVYSGMGSPTCLGTHGDRNVVEAIRDSCNIFFYHLGDIMGVDAITDYTERLGLGADTGFELGNKQGIVAGPEYRNSVGGAAWQPGDDLSAAIGQSDHGYTPLQMSIYTSSVVNGGTRYKTYLLDSVRAFKTHEVIYKTETEIYDRVEISEETLALVKDGMTRVVDNMRDTNSYFDGVAVAVGGKTGTAQVYGKMDYAIFTGCAPIEEPEIVVTCVLEEGVYGTRAAYTVGKVMEKYFELYGSKGE